MSRVLTFSRTFPAFHPKAGEPTYFIEKLTKGFPEYSAEDFTPIKGDARKDLFSLLPLAIDLWSSLHPKYHTIRAGSNWKVGDVFSPRVWSGKPYNSPQITIAPDIRVEKVWEFECLKDGTFTLGGQWVDVTSNNLTRNDGLDSSEFLDWFPVGKYFQGQVICWNKNIEY